MTSGEVVNYYQVGTPVEFKKSASSLSHGRPGKGGVIMG